MPIASDKPMRRTSGTSPYESAFGFSRAIRVGNRIIVSGTAPVEPDGSSTPGDADAVGAVHGELFRDVRPASTMVVISALLRPEWRIEIEAEALVGNETD